MGRTGQARFERELAWDRSRDVLVRMYDDLLRGREPADVPALSLAKLGLWPEQAEVPARGGPAPARVASGFALDLDATPEFDNPAAVRPG
jgi:hypothetical protein